jgi:predicted Ser/Thr protein kinase
MKTHLGHYEIVSELGRGGMGVVYKGYEPALTRYVAIKELSSTLAHDPVVVERFLREARSMALLSEPHIIQIHFIGQENDQPFFAMEFIDGVSVAQLIKRDGRLASDDALKIVHQTAQGLAAAHDHGVIHRDIKPANLMVSRRGVVKIGDFGIALANHDLSAKLTSKGELVGTPGYLSPEVLQGNPIDQRSDIYALGIVLFEMLTGRTPFADPNVYDLVHAVLQAEIPDVREFNPEVDPEVAAIVATMLAKDPARRYQNMRELIVDLERLPRNAVSGAIKVDFAMAGESSDTLRNVPMAITPRVGPRVATPPPNLGRREPTTPPPDVGRRAAVTPAHGSVAATPVAAANDRIRSAPRIAERESASADVEKKGRWNVLIMGVLMFAAGATWGFRGEITGLLQTISDQDAAYYEAAIVTALGLAITGYWFGVHRWRKRECDAGIGSLANMKWRDCMGLVLEAMRRDGYEQVPLSEQPGDGGNEFLLHRGHELILLGYKHGTAYRIDEADLREFVGDIQMQGAGRGVLATLGSTDSVAVDIVKRYGIELIDGAALWPKVRPFVPATVRKDVRRQTASRTWKEIAIGGACSVVLGVVTFVVASQMAAKATSDRVANALVPGSNATAAAASAAADRKRINVATEAMAKVAALTDAELVQRRAEALKKVKSIAQIDSAGWSSESTLLLTLKQSDSTDKRLSDDVCGILTQYEELRFTRLQMQPPLNSTTPIHWRQCQ